MTAPKYRVRCRGPWPSCGHAEGTCTSSPDYQAAIKPPAASPTYYPVHKDGQLTGCKWEMTAPNPEGDVVLVPREPTNEEVAALSKALRQAGGITTTAGVLVEAARAMLSAAPAALQPSPSASDAYSPYEWSDADQEHPVSPAAPDGVREKVAAIIRDIALAQGTSQAARDAARRAKRAVKRLAALPPVSGEGLEPVAWRYRWKDEHHDRPWRWAFTRMDAFNVEMRGYEVQPLYARQQAATGREAAK